MGLLEERDKKARWQGIPLLLRKLHNSSHINSDLSKSHSVIKVHIRQIPNKDQCPHLYILLFFLKLLNVSEVCKQALFCGNAGAVITAVHGGDVVRDRRQEDTTGVCVT